MGKNTTTDHDLLITLNAKVDNLSIDVKTYADGLNARVALLENWKEQIDIYHAKIPLEEYKKLAESYKGLLSNWKLITIFGIPVLGIVIAIATEFIKNFFGF